jgi:hypothetical protein
VKEAQMTKDEGNIRVALQPDGLLHLVMGSDWLRSVCGLQLIRHDTRYEPVHSYGSKPNHCSQCAAIFDRRARFPQSSNEELKPVLERIAKLFALGESPNENEAAAALALANKLLEKHNLSRGVVEDSAQQKAEKAMTDSLGALVQAYKYTLAGATAYLHDLEWYRTSRLRTNRWEELGRERSAYDKHIVFVGLSANVATALVTFPYLVATAEAFSRAVRRETGEASGMGDYKQGFADRIEARVYEHKRAARSHPGAAELIRVGTEIARNAMRIEELFFSGGFRIGHGIGDSEAYRRGYQDGGRVDLHGAQANRMLDEG